MLFASHIAEFVSLHHSSFTKPLRAHLSFGAGRTITARLEAQPFGSQKPRLFSSVEARRVDGGYFTLWQCQIYRDLLLAELVIGGERTRDYLQLIEIRYSGLTAWYLGGRKIRFSSGKRTSMTRVPARLVAAIQEGHRSWTLRSNFSPALPVAASSREIFVDFAIESAAADQRMADIGDKGRQLACLLSILSGAPVSIVSIAVQARGSYSTWAYFPAFDPAEDAGPAFARHCGVRRIDIARSWPKIVQRFYESDLRMPVWVRLSGMRRYEGYWDFLALGWVALIDRYTIARTRLRPIKGRMSASKVTTFQTALESLRIPLKKTERRQIVALAAAHYAPTLKVNFESRFRDVMDRIDPFVASVINLTNAQFDHIKELRDDIAHSNVVELSRDPRLDVGVIIAKLDLLLTYWAFRDLGLPKSHFLKALANGRCGVLRQRAIVDERALVRVREPHRILAVTPENYRRLRANLKGRWLHFAVLIRETSGELEFSEQLAAKLCKPEDRGPGLADILELPPDSVVYLGHAFLESGDHFLEIHAAYLIDGEKLSAGG